VSSLIAIGACALYVYLVVARPRIAAALVFALFAWVGYHEAVHGNLGGVAYAICCGLVYGGMPILVSHTFQRTGADRA
jgi:hypothetical protein